MTVGIVARQVSVIDPEDALSVEVPFQAFFDFIFGERLVAMGGQQTACGGEYRPASVALDGTAFEHEVETVYVLPRLPLCQRGAVRRTEGWEPLVVEMAVDGVVEFCRELLAPAVETEVEQAVVTLIVGEGDESMIAGPSVVRMDN